MSRAEAPTPAFDHDTWLATLRRCLPAPVVEDGLVGGGTVLRGGDPTLVVARLNDAGLRLSLPRLRFWGVRPVLVEDRVAALAPAMLALDDATREAVVKGLVAAIAAMRRAELRPCGRCELLRAPEEVAVIAMTKGACPFCQRVAL